MNEEESKRVPLPWEPLPAAPAARSNRLTYVTVFVLAAALLAAFVGFHLSRQYRVVWAQWEARQTSLADDRSRMVSAWLKERQSDAEALATRAQVIAALAPKRGAASPAAMSSTSADALGPSLDRFAHPFGYSAIYVLNPQGRVVAQSTQAGELDDASRGAARQAMDKGEPCIELFGDTPDKSQLSFSAPVFGEDFAQSVRRPAPRPFGAVVLRMQLAQGLFPLLLSEGVPTRSGEIVLLRKVGDEAVYITPLRHLQIGATGLRRPYGMAALAGRAALEGKERFDEFVDYRGVRVFAATRRIPATGWGLYAKIDRDEALEDFRRMAWLETVAAVLLLVTFGGCVAAYQRYSQSAERARVAEALRRANAYNRSLIEASLDPLVTIAGDGKITDVNSATEKATGRSRQKLIGTDFSDYFTDPEKARAGYQQVFREGAVQDYELELRHRDGRLTPVLYNASVYRDETGEVRGVFAAARDISELKRAAEAARRANAYNRRLIEASLDPLVTISPDGRIADVNRATEKVTGHSREELVGTDFSDYFTDPEKARAGYQQVFREGAVQDYELEIRHRDGHLTPVLYNAAVYRDEGGNISGVFAAARDITDRKRAEEEVRLLNQTLERRVRERTAELEAANKEMEAFTYSVSHDLRAPLRHVDGFSKLLLESYVAALPVEARHYVERIRHGARRMGLMVDDLLNLTRVGRRELNLQLTGLNSLLEEVRQELETEAEGRKIEWRFGSLPFVECDPALMKQVFANLLANALKFTRPRETAVIEVGAREENHSPAVFVRDNGVGFSMKYADKLFGVFQRLHRPEDFEGTGVGLATVQRIVQKHGGRVWAESELNRGATFFFTLGQGPEPAPSPNSKSGGA